jgi:cytochrome oxidase Cu insertion factor (SCO1/SenC/PrrC family)
MRRTLLALVLVGCSTGSPAHHEAAPVAPAAPRAGAKIAPDFTLNDTEGQPVTLSKLRQNGPVILAFFPKAFTGG